MYTTEHAPHRGHLRVVRAFSSHSHLPLIKGLRSRCVGRRLVRLVWLLAIGVGGGPTAGVAQADTLHLDLNRNLAEQLVPFEEIYRIAQRNSPSIREESSSADSKIHTIGLHRKNFLSTISLAGGANWGNSSIIAAGTNNFDSWQLTNGYRGGLQMMIPLDVFVNRPGRIRQAEADYRTALARVDVARQSLRRELNKVYHELLTAQRLLQVYVQDETAARVAFLSAELDWQNGRATVQEYSGASRVYTDVRVKVENTRGGFMASLYDLTVLAGVDIGQLKR